MADGNLRVRPAHLDKAKEVTLQQAMTYTLHWTGVKAADFSFETLSF